MSSDKNQVRFSLNPNQCYELLKKTGGYDWEGYNPPESWLDEFAVFLHDQNHGVIKWINNQTPNVQEIKSALCRHLGLTPLDRDPSPTVKNLRKILPRIFAVMTKKIKDPNLRYNDTDSLGIAQNILEGLPNCVLGVIERVDLIWYRLTLQDSINGYLHAMRVDIVEKIARSYFRIDNIYPGNEVHELSKYFSTANAMGRGVLPIQEGRDDLTQILQERIDNGFRQNYRPLLMQQYIEERFKAHVREYQAYGEKIENGFYSQDTAESWVRYFNAFFNKTPKPATNPDEVEEYTIYRYCEMNEEDQITDINWSYVREVIYQNLIGKIILNDESGELIVDVNNAREVNYWLQTISTIEEFNKIYININNPSDKLNLLDAARKTISKKNNQLYDFITNESLYFVELYIRKIPSSFFSKNTALLSSKLSTIKSDALCEFLLQRTHDGKTIAMVLLTHGTKLEVENLLSLIAKMDEKEQSKILNAPIVYSGIISKIIFFIRNLFGLPKSIWTESSHSNYPLPLPLLIRYFGRPKMHIKKINKKICASIMLAGNQKPEFLVRNVFCHNI